MKFVVSSLILLLLSSTPTSILSETSCSSDEDCLTKNRQACVNNVCGACRQGFVEPLLRKEDSACINLDDVNWKAFLKNYQPIYRDDVSKEDRLERLRETFAFLIAFYANRTTTTTSSIDELELGWTPYSADTEAEYQQRSGFRYVNLTGTDEDLSILENVMNETLPEKRDWTQETEDHPKAVTSVKDQGRCGCCWAVSAAGAIEGAAAVVPENNGYLQSMSWQQFISCNDQLYQGGCDGGSIAVALGYALLAKGVTTNNDYKYTDYKGTTTKDCKRDKYETAVTIENPRYVLDFTSRPFDPAARVDVLKGAVARQPVSIAMKSACRTLSNYRKGIITDDGDCECSDLNCIDHAVLLVGYDDTTDPPSWKLKNSWGDKWGEDGYFRVSQSPKGLYGLFGLLAHSAVPLLAANQTAMVKDEQQDVPLKTWAIVLIVAACLVVCCGLVGLVKKHRDAKAAGGEE